MEGDLSSFCGLVEKEHVGNVVQAAFGVAEDADRLGWRAPTQTDGMNGRGVCSKGNSLCAFLGQKLGATIQQ